MSGRAKDFGIGRRVAETAISRGVFRPRQAGGLMVAGSLGRRVYSIGTRGGVTLAVARITCPGLDCVTPSG
jgi:hypothetical protein